MSTPGDLDPRVREPDDFERPTENASNVPRSWGLATGMFLPIVIILLVALAVILWLVL